MPDRWDESFELGEFLHYCTYVLRSAILLRSHKDSCILTTKLLCDLLGDHGIKTMPVTFQVTALNAAAWQDVQEGTPVRLHTEPDDPHYAIQCAFSPEYEEDLLHGHLALIAANEWLVDGSIDQLSRPARGVHIMPLTAELPFGVMDLIEGKELLFDLPDGGAVVYEPHAEDLNYLRGPDFKPLDPDAHKIDVLLADADAEARELVRLAVETGKFPTLPRMPESLTTTAIQIAEATKAHDLTPDEARRLFMRHGYAVEEFTKAVKEATANAEKLAERLSTLPVP